MDSIDEQVKKCVNWDGHAHPALIKKALQEAHAQGREEMREERGMSDFGQCEHRDECAANFQHIDTLEARIKASDDALFLAIKNKEKAEDAARMVTLVWEKALTDSLPSGMRELVMEAVFQNSETGSIERLLEIERSAKGLIKVMKEYPLNREWWWKYKEALEQALEERG